jgi:hypothetical protein
MAAPLAGRGAVKIQPRQAKERARSLRAAA